MSDEEHRIEFLETQLDLVPSLVSNYTRSIYRRSSCNLPFQTADRYAHGLAALALSS